MAVKLAASIGAALALCAGCAGNKAATDRVYSKNFPTNEERLNFGRIGVAVGKFRVDSKNVQRKAERYGSRPDHEVAARVLANLVTRILTSYPAGGGLALFDESKYYSRKLPAAPKERWGSLDNALNASELFEALQPRLGYAIIERVNSRESRRLGFIDDHGPGFPGDNVDYSRCTDRYDTVLELCVTKIGFESFGGAAPEFRLYVHAEVKVVKTAGNALVYHDLFKYSGESETASRLLDNDGVNLRKEIERGVDYLAWQIGLLMRPASDDASGRGARDGRSMRSARRAKCPGGPRSTSRSVGGPTGLRPGIAWNSAGSLEVFPATRRVFRQFPETASACGPPRSPSQTRRAAPPPPEGCNI